jgi:hypothetical protein
VIALLAVATASVLAALSPAAVTEKYAAAIAKLHEPRIFVVEYALLQTGTRALEQTHQIFWSGTSERDETTVINGTHTTRPTLRFFHGRPYRYAATRLAPRPSAYTFHFMGTRKDGHHLDYVFRLRPKGKAPAFAVTEVTIDGVAFLPLALSFATASHGGRGSIDFAKREKYWVIVGAAASAREPEGVAHERLVFYHWRFPPALPRATFIPPKTKVPAPLEPIEPVEPPIE